VNRELPVRPGRPTPGWVRGLVVGTTAALVTVAWVWQAGAPTTGDPSPYPTVTRTVPGA
jgi:hypothetical protein